MFRKIIDLLRGHSRPQKEPARVHEIFSAKKGEKPPSWLGIKVEQAPPIGARPIITPPEAERLIPEPEPLEPTIPQGPEEEKPPEVKPEKPLPPSLKASAERIAEKVARQDEQLTVQKEIEAMPAPAETGVEALRPIEREEKPLVEEAANLVEPQVPRELEEKKSPLGKDIPKEDEAKLVVSTITPPKEKRFINVGIDFGTSGTKVIFRDIIGRKSWVLEFENDLTGYSDYVFPSSIRIIDGAIYFGAEAEKRAPKGSGIRSFKICMVCESGGISPSACSLTFDKRLHPEPKVFNFPLEDNKIISMSPLKLGTFFLGHVIRRAKDKITKMFSELYDLQITYNMCVPVNFVINKKVLNSFNHCLFLAYHLSEVARDGSNLKDLDEYYKILDINYCRIPSAEKRQTFVQPETVAGIFQYMMSPRTDEGLYAIVDIGAGTSDISFFRLSKISGEMALSIYEAQTHLIGANEVDNALLRFLADRRAIPNEVGATTRNEWLQKIRTLKERNGETSHKIRTATGEFTITSEDFERICTPVGEKVFTKYQETWRNAYRKETSESKWEKYDLFLIGGGSKIRSINKKLEKKPWERIQKINRCALVSPTDLIMESGLSENSHETFQRLAIAYGLSFHPAMYPNIKYPDEVSEFRPDPPTRDLPPWYRYWEQD